VESSNDNEQSDSFASTSRIDIPILYDPACLSGLMIDQSTDKIAETSVMTEQMVTRHE